MTDDSNTVDENKRNVKENKNDSVKKPTGKAAVHPPVSEMVLDSFRALKKRNGTSAEEIISYIEGNFQVNINRMKSHIKKFLQKGVADGLFDQVNGSGGDIKFKVKKKGKVNKATGKSKSTKLDKRTREVRKVPAITKKETGKAMRKTKNDKVRSKKRMGA